MRRDASKNDLQKASAQSVEDLSAALSQVPIHKAQIAELNRRQANLQSQPAIGLTWVEVQRRVRSRHGR